MYKENNPLYICYSEKQKKFLMKNGLRFAVRGKSIDTDKLFWVFMRDEKLDKLLTIWRNNDGLVTWENGKVTINDVDM